MFDEEEKWLLQGDPMSFGAFRLLPVAIHEVRGHTARVHVTAAHTRPNCCVSVVV